MTYRLLHIGDVHLQSSHLRNADRLASLGQAVDIAAATPDLTAILIPGDLFHARPTTEDRNNLADRLQDLARLAPVVLVQGNHDEPGSLEIFTRLRSAWPIYLATRPEVVRIPTTPTGISVACFCLPYPHKAGMVAASVEHQALGATTRSLFDPIAISAAEELAAAAAEGALPVMIGHVSVGGAVASSGQPQIGHELEIDESFFARLNQPAVGDLYCGLNHIHKHQVVGTAVYAGSIARLDFAEREPKGVIEVECQRDGVTWEHRWRFVPLDVPKMVHVEGSLSREGFVIDAVDGEAVSTGPDVPGLVLVGGEWAGADIRVRYRFVKAEVNAIDVAHIHAEFAGCRSLKLDPVAILEHSVRAPEIAAAVTLEQKVRAYADRSGISITDGLIAKVTALQAQPGDAVLQQVNDTLLTTPVSAAAEVCA